MVGMPSRAMLNILRNLVGATRSFLETQKSLALENLALRHQVGVLKRTVGNRRLKLGTADRGAPPREPAHQAPAGFPHETSPRLRHRRPARDANPMDLYYRALSNAGLWCVGRLQTDADRARVLEGLSSSAAGDGASTAELGHIAKRLAPRWFLMRDVHAGRGTLLLQPRWAMSFLRGPMTLSEFRRAGGRRRGAS